MKQFHIFLLTSSLCVIAPFICSSSSSQPIEHHTHHHHGTSVFSTSSSQSNATGGTSKANAEQQSIQSASTDQTLYQQLLSAYDYLKNSIPNSIDYVWNKKYTIVASGLCISYIYLCYHLHNVHSITKNPQSWCNWKQIIPLTQIASTPHQDLIPQLLRDIQKKYYLKNQSTKTTQPINLMPLEQFIQDIQQELLLLTWYLNTQKTIKLLHISFLFNFLHKEHVIKDKINRLQTLLDIFITWQTDDLLKKEI